MSSPDLPAAVWWRQLFLLSLLVLHSITGRAQSAVGLKPYANWPGYFRPGRGGTLAATASRTRLVTSIASLHQDPNAFSSIQVFDISAGSPSRPDSILTISNSYVGKPVLFGDSQWCAVLCSKSQDGPTTFVRLYDVRHANAAALVAELPYEGSPIHLSAEGSLLVVTHSAAQPDALFGGAISLIDVSHPEAPVRGVTIKTYAQVSAARVIGKQLLSVGVPLWGFLLTVYDLSDAGVPVFRGQYELLSVPTDVASAGSRAFVGLVSGFGAVSGIMDVDISSPPASVPTGSRVGSSEASFALRVVGSSLLGIDRSGKVTRWSTETRREIESIRLLDPGLFPSYVSYDISDSAATGVDVSGQVRVATWGPMGDGLVNYRSVRLEANDTSTRVAAVGRRVFLGNSSSSPVGFLVRVFDVSPSGAVTEIARGDGQGRLEGQTENFDVDASGGRMVLEQTGGLAVFDVSNPSAPVRLAMVEGTADRGGFRIRGNRLVTARGSELRLYDLPPQGPPVLLGSVGRAPTLFDGVLDADGATVAVADYSVKFGNSVAFYGIGDPAHPQELSRYQLADGMAPGSVKLSGQFAYVAASWDGVQILDLRDPKKPVLAAHLALAGREFTEASGIAVRETQLFVATGNGGLVVYDVADPYHPRLAGRYQVPGGAADVALCDGGVCVAARECGLQVFSTFPLAADAPRRSRLSGSSDFKVSLSRSGLEGANPVVTAESATSLPAGVWEPVPPSWLQLDDAGWTIVAPTAAPPRFFRFRVEFP